MKQILCIFTWCIMFMVLLWTLGACATSPTFERMERHTYMNRALEFDKKHQYDIRTPKYLNCYTGFTKFMWENCKELADVGMMPEFWGCADAALDGMEECLDGGKQ